VALRGSLHEFELAEIFQLISRDAKTGQLVLSHEDNEAFVIFSQGSVAAAGAGEDNLQTILFRYLMSAKKYSEEELNELLYVCQGEMRQFSQELTNRGYLSSGELVAITHMAVEDLACSLFLWEEGNYRFDSLDSIQEYIVGGVTFPVDAITMEAMRRSDEWKRIRQHISADTIFALVNNPTGGLPAFSPLTNPEEYIAHFVDGQASVTSICERSILLPYRVFESLFGLWQKSTISPLAVKRQPNRVPPVPLGRPDRAAAAVSVSVVITVVCALFAFYVVGQKTFFRTADIKRTCALGALRTDRNQRKAIIADLQFRVTNGYAPLGIRDLVKENLVSKNDLFPLQYKSSPLFQSHLTEAGHEKQSVP
jgi:hypothetical protein